jgi:hypothetical protein
MNDAGKTFDTERGCMKTCMKITVILLLLILCGLSLSNSLLFAQRRGGARGGQGKSEGQRGVSPGSTKPAEFDTAPFDITREQLPPVYFGHNIQLIYKAINERLTRNTDVAETAARNPESGKPAADSLLTGIIGKTYAFRVVPAENFYSDSEQTLQSYCPLSAVLTKGVEDKTLKGFRIDHSPQMDNHFIYTDDKGKQIEIEELKFRDYTIAFENFGQFSVEKTVLPSVKQAADKGHKKSDTMSHSDDVSEHEMIIGKLVLPSAEAKRLRESITLLAVCSLVDPYLTSETVHRIGTPEKPGEYLAQHEYLHVRLLELWFYDFETGKVLMKMKPTHDASTPPHEPIFPQLLANFKEKIVDQTIDC